MSMKNPLTPAGIEQAIFRFVEQHLDHCATAVPNTMTVTPKIKIIIIIIICAKISRDKLTKQDKKTVEPTSTN